MKILTITASFLFLIIFAASSGFSYHPAQELEPGKRSEIQSEATAARKLQRGFLNVALSPLEISKELSEQYRKDFFPPSWLMAMGKGAGFMLVRAVVGAYELVTFPIPVPGNYKPILQPEFPMALVETKK